MGAQLEAVATARPGGGLHRAGALHLSDEAARACLERGGRQARDLDFLINAGVYRNKNLGEPALASIIQEDIGANPDPPLQGGHGTFSFDVANGACGVLTGIHVLDGFLSSAAIDLGMVVTADADPGSGRSEGFPFRPLGGAVLLSRGDDDRGFTHFSFATFPEFADLFEGAVAWEEGAVRRAIAARVPAVPAGKNVLRIRQRPGYEARCAECAVTAGRAFVDALGLAGPEIDLLVASPSPAEVPDALGRGLGIAADRVVQVGEGLDRVHTAGIVAALESAMRSGRFAEARRVLVATVGSGITVGLALYQNG